MARRSAETQVREEGLQFPPRGGGVTFLFAASRARE